MVFINFESDKVHMADLWLFVLVCSYLICVMVDKNPSPPFIKVLIIFDRHAEQWYIPL